VDLVPADIVLACQRGDERAWGELVSLTHREVYTLCLRILGDPDDAAEATQDAYLKAWRGLRGFRGDSMFGTWLYRVATNAALSKQRTKTRRRSRETGTSDEILTEQAGTDSTEGSAGARMELARVHEALALLPEHYRTAVVLRDVLGYSIEEAARQMKCSPTAAKVRVHRGRKKLKELVYPEGDE
jgi:RNA polymerase sigma-70 factor, ECF subfamily